MGILDVDKLLGQEPDPLAAAAVNLTQAAGQNPQEHIERRKLSNASGVPAALMDDPEVRERARRDAFAAPGKDCYSHAGKAFAQRFARS